MFGLARLNTLSANIQALTYSYVNSVLTANSTTIVLPTLQAGDIIFIIDRQRTGNTTIPTAVTPTGYTNLYNYSAASATYGMRYMISYKIAVAGDSGATVTGITYVAGGSKVALVYRPSKTPLSIAYIAGTAQVTDSAPTNQTLSLSGVPGGYVGLVHYGSTSSPLTIAPTTGFTRQLGAATSNMYSTWESTGPTVSFSNQTITMADSGTNILVSGYIIIA